MKESRYTEGIELLRHPVLPLVSMVQFLFMTGPFSRVSEVISELPEPIETDRTTYVNPRALLAAYLDILCRYEKMKQGETFTGRVVDEQNREVDSHTAWNVCILQEIMTRELEKINSALCAPCGCTLCCTGPARNMEQEFFEIPLAPGETYLFDVRRCESAESRSRSAHDEDDLLCDGKPFYCISEPELFHWKNGWSLILPKASTCPNLEPENGRCLIYDARPDVCRRPQIFPYVIEPLEKDADNRQAHRIRQALLAVVDCPYVRDLQDEIAEYAAAGELQLVLKENKA
jgi:Fe-S-cluster containining protein